VLSGGIVKATSMHEDNTNERWVNKQKIYVNTFIVEMRALLYKATGTLRPALDNVVGDVRRSYQGLC
jgi:hypothetical protein